jgi:hypothetical protein
VADAASHLTWRHMAHAESYRAGGPELFRESGNESPFLKFQELVGAAMRLVHTAQHEYSRGSGGAAAGTLRACELDTQELLLQAAAQAKQQQARWHRLRRSVRPRRLEPVGARPRDM